MALNFGLAGKVYDSAEVTITAEQITAYADASGDPNPRHQPGDHQVASLIFGVVPGWEAMGQVGSDPELGVDNPLMILHGEQEFRYHDLIRPGDTLVITPSLDSVEDKGKGATYVSKFTASSGVASRSLGVQELWPLCLLLALFRYLGDLLARRRPGRTIVTSNVG